MAAVVVFSVGVFPSGTAFVEMGTAAANEFAGGELSDDFNFFVDGRLKLFHEPVHMLGRGGGDAGAQVADSVIEAAGRHGTVSMPEFLEALDTVNRVTNMLGRIMYSRHSG